jgi:hypothetical protein
MATVFFSEGAVASSISSCKGELLEYVVSSERRLILESLRDRATMVLIVRSANQSPDALLDPLTRSGLLEIFQSNVIFATGLTNRVSSIAKEIRASEDVFLVDEDCSERAQALNIGFAATIPHALLVSEVLDGAQLTYVRISQLQNQIDRLKDFLELPMVPFHITTDRKNSVYVITTTKTVGRLRDLGMDVRVFGEHNPQLTDPYLARDDRPVPPDTTAEKYATEFLAGQGKARFIMEAVDNSLLLALPVEMPIEEIHFPVSLHGHNRRLMANMELLSLCTNPITENSREAKSRIPLEGDLSKEILDELKRGITPDIIQKIHAPYIGEAALPPSNVSVVSRHISHDDNRLVTEALCWHLD